MIPEKFSVSARGCFFVDLVALTTSPIEIQFGYLGDLLARRGLEDSHHTAGGKLI